MYSVSLRQIRFTLFILFIGTAFLTAADNPSDTSPNPGDKKNVTTEVINENIELNDFYLSNDGDNEGVRVDDGGNVTISGALGVGGFPQRKLHVFDSTLPYVHFTADSSGHTAQDGFSIGLLTDANTKIGYFRLRENWDLQFWTNNAPRFIITSEGNLLPNTNFYYNIGSLTKFFKNVYSKQFISSISGGIGTAIDIQTPDNQDIYLKIGTNTDDYGYYWKYEGTGSGNNNDLELWSEALEGDDIQIYEIKQDGIINFTQNIKINKEIDINGSDNIKLNSNYISGDGDDEGIAIDNDGKVCIGTSSPDTDAKLTINGKISARDITIKADAGADFVFEKDYALPSLYHVEQFVKANKHLPEIPSVKEMQENGIQVSEMQTKLLQKIEELTLYVIELEKENKKQNQIIEKLVFDKSNGQ